MNGALDLASGVVRCPLSLWRCRLDRIDARQADLGPIDLGGSSLAGGFYGDGLRCSGHMLLNGEFFCAGELRLLDAAIRGDLNCTDGRFENGCGSAVTLDRAEISGSVRFYSSDAKGAVRFVAVRIGGNLDCGISTFESTNEFALSADRAEISGSVFLRSGFTARSGVRLIGAVIGGDLDLGNAWLEPHGGYALLCDSARVGGAFSFVGTHWGAGRISLASMQASILCDTLKDWREGCGRLILDGFVYETIAFGPSDAPSRIEWLLCQEREHLEENFKHQPWDQLMRVLNASGHTHDARSAAIAKQDALRRSGRIRGFERLIHWLYGTILGYGFRPSRMLAMIVAVWLGCTVAYWAGANPQFFGSSVHLIAPANRNPSTECLIARAVNPIDDPCPPHKVDYRTFVPGVYSADVMLPILNLGYREEWKPVINAPDGEPLFWGQMLRYLYWAEIILGWLAGLQLAGMLGNLIKNEWRPKNTELG